jgi:replicative DNA helicase
MSTTSSTTTTVANGNGTPPPKSMRIARALSADYLAALEARANGSARYVPTGLAAIDRQLPGLLHEGHLAVVAGRPAMGKTALGQQIAEHVAALGRSVFFFSLEMSGHEVTERAVSRRSGVPVPALKTGDLDQRDWQAVIEAAEAFSHLPMLVDDASFDISGLVSKSRAAASNLERHGLPPLGAIFVDYLQLVGAKAANRTLEVSQVTAGLKRLARDLAVPVVALSQLNRGVEGRTDKRPTLADLRESGSIEQDADLILFVYRDDYYHPESADRGIAELIVGKNRHGSTSTVRLAFVRERVLFEDLARD